MKKSLKNLLKLSAVSALAMSATMLPGCGDPDPGVCFTGGEFPKSQVDRGYAQMVCGDWVKMLLTNCVSISGLPLNPTTQDVSNFCGNNVTDKNETAQGGYPAYGNSNSYSFQVRHSCNFIDNPNYECRKYAAQSGAAPQSLTRAAMDPEFTSKIEVQVNASTLLKDSASRTSMYLEGSSMNLGTREIR